MNNRAAIILLAFLLIPQTGKAQISFDPGEACLNVVDFAAAKGLDEYHGHVFSVQYLHERFINEQFCVAPGAGLKVHLTPHFGIMASVNYDGYLMKGPDALKMASALGAGIGLCFQIPGW